MQGIRSYGVLYPSLLPTVAASLKQLHSDDAGQPNRFGAK